MDNDSKRPEDKSSNSSPHRDEYDRMVEQIKAKRRALSKSIWTDEPLLKPQKSIWIDDNEDIEPQKPEQEQPAQPEAYEPPMPPAQEAAEQVQPESEPEPQPDPFNAHTPEYFEANPVIQDARDEQLAFGVQPENYDEVIMPFVNEYSVERKLPDRRKRLSRKPKANADIDYAVKRESGKSVKNKAKPQENAAPVMMHKLRHERFFDEEGEPLSRHDPEKSRRKRPQMVPLSRRKEKINEDKTPEDENE